LHPICTDCFYIVAQDKEKNTLQMGYWIWGL